MPILKAAFEFLRLLVWPIAYPILKNAFEAYVKDAQKAAQIDEATFASIQARTAREKLDASKKMFQALKR